MFSVVIPVFNHHGYLVECVLSAARSPLVSEILLLDDGSSDSSPNVAQQLAGGALGKVRNLTSPGRGNRGAHSTLNELIGHATGEWIAVLNSDDVFTPSRFDLIRRRLRSRSFDLVFGNVLVMDAQGRQLGGKRAMFDPQLPFPAAFDIHQMVRAADWLPLLAHQNFLATTSNMVFRKSLFELVGGFREFRYVHDWDFCLRAALRGTLEYVPHALTGYRVHAANTIKEDSARVDAEVHLLFEQLQEEHPRLRQNTRFSEGLAQNPYLVHRVQPALTLVLPEGEGRDVYADAVSAMLSPVEITDGLGRGRYIYAPHSAAEALLPRHVANALLALEIQDADFVLVSHSLAEPPLVGATGLRNHAIFRHSLADAFLSGHAFPPQLAGRVARLFPGGGTIQSLRALLPGTGVLPSPVRPEPLPASLRSPEPSAKPLIFILPALFAVGGVERLIIDMMRELADRFRFVVITVERLHERQGSLHGPAEGLALGFFDLAELAPPALFVSMLERLRDVYRPALVWIPNGSPWQCDHAADLRRVFSEVPIVDQQVYDTEAGWISRYRDPGIRSYDRFIAINRKIEDTFIRKYALPPDRIDMIYHSVNLGALGSARRSQAQRLQSRAEHGLPLVGEIFGWVGRFTVQKRPLQFLEFVLQAARSHADCHFVMIGDGELGAAADRFIQQNAMVNVTRVHFSNRMGDVYAAMSGLLGASEYEGLPISMLEALAMGVPVFSTDVGDVGLVLEKYQAGSVTPAAWNLERYTADFDRWFGGLIRYRKNAEEAAALVRQHFGSPAVAKEYEKSFRSALKQRVECYTEGS